MSSCPNCAPSHKLEGNRMALAALTVFDYARPIKTTAIPSHGRTSPQIVSAATFCQNAICRSGSLSKSKHSGGSRRYLLYRRFWQKCPAMGHYGEITIAITYLSGRDALRRRRGSPIEGLGPDEGQMSGDRRATKKN